MILAIGSDLCNIERIQASLTRWGEKFENRVFTEIERAKGNSRPFTKAGTLAKRFAAKHMLILVGVVLTLTSSYGVYRAWG